MMGILKNLFSKKDPYLSKEYFDCEFALKAYLGYRHKRNDEIVLALSSVDDIIDRINVLGEIGFRVSGDLDDRDYNLLVSVEEPDHVSGAYNILGEQLGYFPSEMSFDEAKELVRVAECKDLEGKIITMKALGIRLEENLPEGFGDWLDEYVADPNWIKSINRSLAFYMGYNHNSWTYDEIKIVGKLIKDPSVLSAIKAIGVSGYKIGENVTSEVIRMINSVKSSSSYQLTFDSLVRHMAYSDGEKTIAEVKNINEIAIKVPDKEIVRRIEILGSLGYSLDDKRLEADDKEVILLVEDPGQFRKAYHHVEEKMVSFDDGFDQSDVIGLNRIINLVDWEKRIDALYSAGLRDVGRIRDEFVSLVESVENPYDYNRCTDVLYTKLGYLESNTDFVQAGFIGELSRMDYRQLVKRASALSACNFYLSYARLSEGFISAIGHMQNTRRFINTYEALVKNAGFLKNFSDPIQIEAITRLSQINDVEKRIYLLARDGIVPEESNISDVYFNRVLDTSYE